MCVGCVWRAYEPTQKALIFDQQMGQALQMSANVSLSQLEQGNRCVKTHAFYSRAPRHHVHHSHRKEEEDTAEALRRSDK